MPERNASGSDVTKVKSCKQCNAFITISATKCSFCGAEVQSKPKQITPDENVHRGKVLNTGNAQPANLPTKNKPQSYLKIDLTIEEDNAAIFKIYFADKPETIRAILVVRFWYQRLSDSNEPDNQRLLGEQVVHNVTKNKHRKIGQLEKYVRKTWENSQIKILKHDDKTWASIWPALIKQPG